MPRFSGVSIGGDGMRERLRSTTFALLGLVTAIGLVLVGIAYNQGWPEFIDSPILGPRTERVGDARIAAEAVATPLRDANDSSVPGSTGQGRGGFDNGRSTDSEGSIQQQLPARAPDNQGQPPSPPPSVPGGAEPPVAPTEVPVTGPAATSPPTSAGTPPAQSPAPVPTSPPASPPAAPASVPGKGKAKGHEKNGKSTPVPPAVPAAPPVPEAVPAEVPPPVPDGPGNGHGKAKGHYK